MSRMPPDYHYTTAFGATLDIEIDAARRAGMPLEKIATELGHRYGELFDVIVHADSSLELHKEVGCSGKGWGVAMRQAACGFTASGLSDGSSPTSIHSFAVHPRKHGLNK